MQLQVAAQPPPPPHGEGGCHNHQSRESQAAQRERNYARRRPVRRHGAADAVLTNGFEARPAPADEAHGWKPRNLRRQGRGQLNEAIGD